MNMYNHGKLCAIIDWSITIITAMDMNPKWAAQIQDDVDRPMRTFRTYLVKCF